MSVTAWAVALEVLDREVEAMEAALGSGADVDLEALPPEARRDLGPLPPELLDRARAVQDRMTRLEQSMADALRRSQGAKALTDRFAVGGEVPRFLDTRG